MAVADKLKALQIKANFIADKHVGLMEINADVHGGIAVLTGEVETEGQKKVAEDLAYEAEGINEVENEIRVVPPTPDHPSALGITSGDMGYGLAEGDAGDTTFNISGEYSSPGPGIPASEQFPGAFKDSDIFDEVQNRLDSQDSIDTSRISFVVTNSVVRMEGSLNSWEELDLLQDIVMNVRGVLGIETDVDIRPLDMEIMNEEE